MLWFCIFLGGSKSTFTWVSLTQVSVQHRAMHTDCCYETALSTSRVAKILGPGLVGILNQTIPVIHYFTIDSLSFFLSAFSIHKLKKDLPDEAPVQQTKGWSAIKEAIVGGYKLVGAYGVGNLIFNLVLGSITIHRFERCLYLGRIVAGTGFIFLSFMKRL